jgi:hypothetical protein
MTGALLNLLAFPFSDCNDASGWCIYAAADGYPPLGYLQKVGRLEIALDDPAMLLGLVQLIGDAVRAKLPFKERSDGRLQAVAFEDEEEWSAFDFREFGLDGAALPKLPAHPPVVQSSITDDPPRGKMIHFHTAPGDFPQADTRYFRGGGKVVGVKQDKYSLEFTIAEVFPAQYLVGICRLGIGRAQPTYILLFVPAGSVMGQAMVERGYVAARPRWMSEVDLKMPDLADRPSIDERPISQFRRQRDGSWKISFSLEDNEPQRARSKGKRRR